MALLWSFVSKINSSKHQIINKSQIPIYKSQIPIFNDQNLPERQIVWILEF
jgi:hypothetical protein